MSQENVEIVRSIYEDWKRGDFSLMDRESEWREVFEPDFEWHTRADLPDAGVRKRYEGIVRLRDEWVDAFEKNFSIRFPKYARGTSSGTIWCKFEAPSG